MVPHPLPQYSIQHVKNIVTPVLSNNGNGNQSFINTNYFQSENTREGMSTFVLNDHKEGGNMVSLKSKCQQPLKFKETIKIEKEDEYDELLRLWNISANRGDVKIQLDKFELKDESSFDKLVHYQDSKDYNELSPIASNTSVNMEFPMSIMSDSNVDDLEKEKLSENLSDDSLFCNEVKFGIVYTCCFCENVFSSKHSLAKHKRKHNFCQYCKAKFKSLKALTNHRKNCIFEKCINSHPRVELSNIALSKKMRSFYKTAFSRDKFPCISDRLIYEVKKELVDSNIHNLNDRVNQTEVKNVKDYVHIPSSNIFNNIVKLEPIEYEENSESFCKNSNSLFNDTVENFVKLEPVDIVEQQLTNDEKLPIPIKEEEIYLCYTPSDKMFECEVNLERNIHANNGTDLSEDELNSMVPRFNHFKSELKEESLTLSEREYKFAYEFVKDDNCDIINNQFFGNLSSRENCNNVETSISQIISVQNDVPKLKAGQLEVVVPNIPYPKMALTESDDLIKNRSEKWLADSKLVSSEQESIKQEYEHSSVQVVNKNINLQSSKPLMKDPENNLVSSKTDVSDIGKTSYSRKIKYVRFTNKPNLNLFIF